ncbi:hypothetical protein FisN_2Hu076 [Fistulifera solaris]|uniref:protein-tyrosine sulfotransferase n=1 Tax=Fistulifera solaris TaxID=1519565 RepID=A0A1Z5KPS2_FISSO|nr:hypothetical protein FisN_2Hu076 [Fistulifera solaris]|eukprot:GAX28102.1 hypothetical protein FisN_2Hu076 [Fistulifera solaris]
MKLLTTKEEKDYRLRSEKEEILWLWFFWVFPVFSFALFARYTVTFSIDPIPIYPGPAAFPKKRPQGWKRTSILPPEEQQHESKHASSTGKVFSSKNTVELVQQIERLKQDYEMNPNSLPSAIEYLQVMQLYVQQFSPSAYTEPLMDLYESIQQKIKQAISTDASALTHIQLLCQLYTEQGIWLFRYLRRVDEAMTQWNECIKINPTCVQAWRARGDAWRTLGDEFTENAVFNYMQALQLDQPKLPSTTPFILLQLVQLLTKNAPEWKFVVATAENNILTLSNQSFPTDSPLAKYQYATTIHRLNLVLMWYHLVHGNIPQAREHLQTGCRTKVAALPPWQNGAELQKVQNTCSIFRKGFWSQKMGSSTNSPIFIMGFIESGATLVERHLVASHSDIIDTSYSVWNQRLTEIRDLIASVSHADLPSVVHSLAESIEQQMLGGYSARFAVDSFWMNYYSIGLLHTIYPNALIVHVVRDPLENLVAASMHDSSTFSDFGLHDYTCNWNVLVELYRAYRQMMRHWDDVLPGRVIHIRYEDWIQDPNGMTEILLKRIGLSSNGVPLKIPRSETAVRSFQPYAEGFGDLSGLLSDLGGYQVPFTLKSQYQETGSSFRQGRGQDEL